MEVKIPVIELNQLNTDDMSKVVSQIANNDPAIEGIDFRYIDNFNPQLQNELSNALANNRSLKIVIFSGVEGVINVPQLVTFLHNNHSLQKFHIEDVDDDIIQLVINALINTTSLHKLNLPSNGFLVTSIKVLCNFIKTNKSVRSLNIVDGHLSSAEVIYLADALRYNTTIKILKVHDKYLPYGIDENILLAMIWINRHPFDYPINQKDILFLPFEYRFSMMTGKEKTRN